MPPPLHKHVHTHSFFSFLWRNMLHICCFSLNTLCFYVDLVIRIFHIKPAVCQELAFFATADYCHEINLGLSHHEQIMIHSNKLSLGRTSFYWQGPHSEWVTVNKDQFLWLFNVVPLEWLMILSSTEASIFVASKCFCLWKEMQKSLNLCHARHSPPPPRPLPSEML